MLISACVRACVCVYECARAHASVCGEGDGEEEAERYPRKKLGKI